MQVSKHQPRQRSATLDPFNDPSHISYSSYGLPTLTRNTPLSSSHRPPPPPPKPHPKPHAHRQYPPSALLRDNIMDAVEDVVTVRRSSDHPPRTRVGRSQTDLPPPTNSRPPPLPASHRSQSQDSVARAAKAMDKSKKATKGKNKTSAYADVIDKLDYSGVGPALFHHDGPFDACAPSRNRHRTKAPMAAWSGHQADEEALANAQQVQPRSPDVFIPYEAPAKKYDAIAEAWGMHEPEPFEEFASAGMDTIPHDNLDEHRGSTNGKRRMGRNPRDVYIDYLDGNNDGPAQRRPTRGNIPPPMPIFPQGDMPPAPASPPEVMSNETPRRNKSLMQRFRKMRDSPNVPVTPYEDDGRPQLSPGLHGRPPNSATYPTDDAFVYVDHVPMKKDKSLPSPPKSANPEDAPADYFDGAESAPSGGAGLGRKTSLLKKVGGVVKGRSSK